MRKRCLWLACMLLSPVLAHAAHSPYDDDVLAPEPFWLSMGFGSGTVNSLAPAPSAGRDAFSFSVDAGMRLTPEWGAGLEFGVVAPSGGCTGHHCTPSVPDFAPAFTHWFLIGEYRSPYDRHLRLRAGLGVSNMCYSYYKAQGSAWEEILEFLAILLSDDYDPGDFDHHGTHWACRSLSALGGSVSVGYQWQLGRSRSSVGLQLRAEAAHFAASSKAGTPAFRHRAVMLQVQLNLN